VEFDAQIRNLKDSHEQRCASMRENHQTNLHHIEQAAHEAHQASAERHAEEMNELRNLLKAQVMEDKELSDALEKEIAHLQVALQERRGEGEQTAKRNNMLLRENEDLRELMNSVQQQHVKLQEMLARQHEGIEASRSIRNQLVQTLMRQDEGDKGAVMMELTEKLKRKIAQALENKQLSHTEHDRIHKDQGESRLERDRGEQRERAPSRLERDRGEGPSRLDRDRGERMEAVPSRLERARRDDVEEKRAVLSMDHEEHVVPPNKDEYGEVRILADEISGITDTSDY
jgi:hypothetical protein